MVAHVIFSCMLVSEFYLWKCLALWLGSTDVEI